MRIQDAYRQAQTTPDAAAAGPKVAASSSASVAGPGGAAAPVKVTVSDKARELSTQSSEASAAKVASLQQAVANGTFTVDPQAIAKRIVEGD